MVHAQADPVDFRLRHLENARVIGVIKAAAQAANWKKRTSPAPSLAKTGPGKTGVVSGRGTACVDYEGGNGYAALIAEVDVNLETGLVRPTRFVVALDCGPISNPDGVRNQIAGGILQDMSRASVEEVTWDQRRITSTDWETYRSLHLVTPAGVPAIGADETAITVTPAAIGNTIFDATGGRLRDLPFTPERVGAALSAAGHGSARA